MSGQRIALAGAGLGGVVGLIAGLARWSSSTIEVAIAIGTVIGFVVLIALPDGLRDHRHRR